MQTPQVLFDKLKRAAKLADLGSFQCLRMVRDGPFKEVSTNGTDVNLFRFSNFEGAGRRAMDCEVSTCTFPLVFHANPETGRNVGDVLGVSDLRRAHYREHGQTQNHVCNISATAGEIPRTNSGERGRFGADPRRPLA